MANRKQTEHEEDQFIHAIMDATLDGHPLKDLRGVSNDQMESIYSFAYEFYEQGKLDEAERLFHFLCIYDLYDTRYWLGLAAIYQLKENYQKAIDIYAVAFTQGKKIIDRCFIPVSVILRWVRLARPSCVSNMF